MRRLPLGVFARDEESKWCDDGYSDIRNLFVFMLRELTQHPKSLLEVEPPPRQNLSSILGPLTRSEKPHRHAFKLCVLSALHSRRLRLRRSRRLCRCHSLVSHPIYFPLSLSLSVLFFGTEFHVVLNDFGFTKRGKKKERI